MLAIVACGDGPRATMMPRRSPLTSVSCALFIATSVPVPIAMPTSAQASAGVVDAVARHRDHMAFFLEPFDQCELVGWLHLAVELGNAQPHRHRLRRGHTIARRHNDLHPGRAQASQRLRACSP